MMLYPTDFVHQACSQIYGSEISERTLRRWKNICHIPAWARQLNRDQVHLLMTFAYLRSKYPKKELCYVDVKRQLLSKPLGVLLLEPHLEASGEPLKGKDLPNFIYEVTKKRVTLRTLYRWANKYSLEFGAKRAIPDIQIEIWLNLASR